MIKPTEILTWCESLDLSSEIARRQYVSRQYYGLFHSVRLSFPQMPVYRDLGTHESVSEFLEKGYVGAAEKKEARKLSYLLKVAKGYRTTADYLLETDFTESDLRTSKQAVSNVFAQLNSVLSFESNPLSATI